MESNPEQSLADIEKVFEDSKAWRLMAKNQWNAAKGKYHMECMARREAGETLTVSDIKALEACAINDVPDVKEAYLEFIKADAKYRDAKVKKENAVRDYWDKKPGR